MFVQVKNGRIVRVSETKNVGDVELDLPEDFDFDHIDRYEVDGDTLIKHDLITESDLDPTPAEPDIYDELAAVYQEGVQSA